MCGLHSQISTRYTLRNLLIEKILVLGRCIPAAIIGAVDTLDQIQKGNASLDVLKNIYGDDPNIPKDTDVQRSQQYVDLKRRSYTFFRYVGKVVDQESVLNKIAHDLSKTWWQVLAMIGIAGVLAFIWTVIMRILGGLMIWTSILVVLLGLGGGMLTAVSYKNHEFRLRLFLVEMEYIKEDWCCR